MDEIQFLKSGGEDGAHAKMVKEVKKIFHGQSVDDLINMQSEISRKLQGAANSTHAAFDSSGIRRVFGREFSLVFRCGFWGTRRM